MCLLLFCQCDHLLELKIAQMLSKFAQIVAKAVFINLSFYKTAPKVAILFGLLKQIYYQNFQKITQSGHTDSALQL